MLAGLGPKSLKAASLVDYMGLAIGLSLGFAILTAPMQHLEGAISRKGN